MENQELLCTCGDTDMQHVDGCEQCVVPGYGCREFEEEEECDMCNNIPCNCDEQYETYKDQKEQFSN